jgi:monothiol glutaredoxin
MDDMIKEQIEKEIRENSVMLYMKGHKAMPLCGFSARVVEILKAGGIDFETRNVLEDDALREGIKEFSDWPTIPQLYVRGEFIGGCDIICQMFETGELQKLLENESNVTS